MAIAMRPLEAKVAQLVRFGDEVDEITLVGTNLPPSSLDADSNP
jgi:hypothetical protein